MLKEKLRNSASAAVLGLGLIVGAGASYAQSAPAAAVSDDVIIVTGSRIARDPNLVSPIPVQSLGEEQIENSGELNLADVVNDVPALVASVTGENSATGANVLNLRGMGATRTLTLVNGRRHVAGFEGSQAVDIGSVPAQLVQRVDVMTGGASAIYGADAVTGVVNFILKQDYEGININYRTGISSEGDAGYSALQFLGGRNFHNDRGNVVLSFDIQNAEALYYGDRDWAAGNSRARHQSNPALRFQRGDITAAGTPNLFNFYDFASTGRYLYGLRIPSQADFIADYTAEFGSAPILNPAEIAFFDQAANAPTRAFFSQPTFSISSRLGVISPADFWFSGVDVDANGTDDCLDSFVGWNNSFFGNGSFGLAGGCWVVDAGGVVRPYEDGLVASDFNGFGGDGIADDHDQDLLMPATDQYTVNLNSSYDLTPDIRGFFEFKYSNSTSRIGGPLNTFYDLLWGAPDNPYLPAALAPVVASSGGLYITRDPTDLGPNYDDVERETFRIVAGLDGEFDNGWTWEVSYNHGEFTRTTTDNNYVILDRWFAAIDAVSGPGGTPVCRSDVDPGAIPATTVFGIPGFDPGIFSFTPGDGQCRPANIWAGPGAISRDAIDFITTTVIDELTLEQTVFSASLAGDTADFFTLPAGPVSFAVGVEYREETSQNTVNDYDLGILPPGSAAGAGSLVSSISGNGSLGFAAESQFFNSSGSYEATDAYIEISVPLLVNAPFAQELTVDGAYRYADYSTIGGAATWKVGGVWTPFDDLSIRGTISQAIRAPNIIELFGPDNPAFFRPVDPCDASEIPTAADPAVRAANCLASGLPVGWVDPLSARFAGVAGGNPDLQEETADTTTIGFVYQPSFVEGLAITVDRWEVSISDAISAVSSQDIVDNCYDSSSFPNSFCGLFTRNTDPASAQFGGFNFLRQTSINFAAIEASGTDFAVTYDFEWAGNQFGLRAVGSKQDNLDFFTNPSDPSEVDPELGEIQRPEWTGTVDVTWERGPVRLGWQTQYMSEQGLTGVEIEDFESRFGPAGIAGASYSHRLYGSYDWNGQIRIYGGINNVTDEEPFITEEAWPVGPRGRLFFIGFDARWG